MRSGFTIATVEATSSEKASRAQRLDENDTTVYVRIEVYAPKTGSGVTGNTEAVWLGDANLAADLDYEAGVYLVPGDSYEFTNMRLTDIYMAATTDGDKVTWLAFP